MRLSVSSVERAPVHDTTSSPMRVPPKSSATMMYGHVESDSDIATHFELVSSLQQKTGGFMAFIPWSFEPNNTEMQDDPGANHGIGGLNLLRMIAISRLYFYNQIAHVQSSWLTNGVGMAQIALQHGADDFGGTLIGRLYHVLVLALLSLQTNASLTLYTKWDIL